MSFPSPTLYLDKGALGTFELHKISDHFQICYSEATLFDLLNDKSGFRDSELSALNDVRALYYYRDADQVFSIHANAIEMMNKVEPFELDFMAVLYRFLNGGGTSSLFDTLHHQLSILLNVDDEIREVGQDLLTNFASDETLEPLKGQYSDRWRVELQRATKAWSQTQDITLRSVFEQNPNLARELAEYFPDTAPNPEQIQTAAMVLGILQMGSDKGILSPDDGRSGKAARNGYVDCLHIMFGLHCQIFLTTDKATLRRFSLLNDFWQLDRQCALVS